MEAEERAEQIVRVVAEHWALHGTTGASMSGIAREAGVTRALVYHYFPNKDALLAAVTKYAGEQILDAIRPDPSLDAGQALRWALNTYFDQVEQGPGTGFNTPFAAATSAATSITGSTPDVQLAWFLKCADMPATGYAHLALSGWLALVEHTARAHHELSATSREEAVQLCINAFQGITKPRSDIDQSLAGALARARAGGPSSAGWCMDDPSGFRP